MERTEAEYQQLLGRAGWRPAGTHYPANRAIGVIEGIWPEPFRGGPLLADSVEKVFFG
jgi:hypothetical protein